MGERGDMTKKEITLLIEAHGSESRQLPLPSSYKDVVDILSFCGDCGTTAYDFTNEHGSSMSLIAEILKEHYKRGSEYTQQALFTNSTSNNLKEVYKRLYGFKYPNGFQYVGTNIDDKYNKIYDLYPNEHETCKLCTENGDMRCLPERKKDRLELHPDYYGIFVLAVEDGLQYGIGNIVRENAVFLFWQNQIRTSRATEDNKRRAFAIINKLKQENPVIVLSDLIFLFHTVLGFTKIYIYDPSCRNLINRREIQKEIVAPVPKDIIIPIERDPGDIDFSKFGTTDYPLQYWIDRCLQGICPKRIQQMLPISVQERIQLKEKTAGALKTRTNSKKKSKKNHKTRSNKKTKSNRKLQTIVH